jgi:uncharacterized membrane protein
LPYNIIELYQRKKIGKGLLRKIIIHYRESIWFLPSLFILGAIISAILITRIDIIFQEQFYINFPLFLLTSVELARSILSVIATSLLTMTAITFSTIMVVFSVYSSQFSPRTLENIISDRLTQIVLGIFISGFTYSIVSLLLIREIGPGTVVLSAVFGIGLSLVCIGYFIRFIQYITVSIQVNNLIEELNDEIFNTLKKNIKEIEDIEKNGKVLTGVSDEIIDMQKDNPYRIFAPKAGHIQLFDLRGLIKLAAENDSIIETIKRVGDYVTESTPIFIVWNIDDDKEKKEKIESSIKKYIPIGNYRNTTQDIDFSLQKLEEIALRAISPGINDPNTAILCIRNLGNILSRICNNYTGKLYFYNNDNNLRLILDNKDFEEILYSTFYKVLNFSRNQISILSSILEAVLIISESKNIKLNKILFSFSQYAINGFNKDLLQPHDIKYLNNKLKKIAEYLDVEESEILIN